MMMLTVVNIGCYYDQVLPQDPYNGNENDTIPTSFTLKIQPIFTAKCDNCHPPTKGLDLTEGNAYASISNPTYINLGTPEESSIYTKPHPTGSHPQKYSTTDAAIVLKWIEEGALNN